MIEEVKKTDFVVIDTDTPDLTPPYKLICTVVFNGMGNDVDTVVIDGNIVVQNKNILILDEDVILEDVRQRYLSVAKRTGIRIEDYVTTWPIR